MKTSRQVQGGRAGYAGPGGSSMRQISARLLLAGVVAATAPAAFGAAEFKLGDEAGVTAGIGLRTSFATTENGAGNGTSNSKDFVIDNARLFFSGHYGKIVKGTLNTDYNSNSDSLIILDAYVGFEFNDYFNIWLGRFLPPQDRANGYGPLLRPAVVLSGHRLELSVPGERPRQRRRRLGQVRRRQVGVRRRRLRGAQQVQRVHDIASGRADDGRRSVGQARVFRPPDFQRLGSTSPRRPI